MLCCTRRWYTPTSPGPAQQCIWPGLGQGHSVACDPRQMEQQGRDSSLVCHQLFSLTCLLFPTEFILSLLEKMQTQEILRLLRLPELGDLGQFFRSLSATTLVSVGALAAILAYWFTHRPKALQPPCNLLMQSEEVEVSSVEAAGLWDVVDRGILKVEAKLVADLTSNGAENSFSPGS